MHDNIQLVVWLYLIQLKGISLTSIKVTVAHECRRNCFYLTLVSARDATRANESSRFPRGGVAEVNVAFFSKSIREKLQSSPDLESHAVFTIISHSTLDFQGYKLS